MREDGGAHIPFGWGDVLNIVWKGRKAVGEISNASVMSDQARVDGHLGMQVVHGEEGVRAHQIQEAFGKLVPSTSDTHTPPHVQ